MPRRTRTDSPTISDGDLLLVEKPQRLPGGGHRKAIVGVFRLLSIQQVHDPANPDAPGPVRIVLEHVQPKGGR